jgi:hypothetical protein
MLGNDATVGGYVSSSWKIEFAANGYARWYEFLEDPKLGPEQRILIFRKKIYIFTL